MPYLILGLLSIAAGLFIVTPKAFVAAWDDLKFARPAKTMICKNLGTTAAEAVAVPGYLWFLGQFTDPIWPLWPFALLSASMFFFGIMAIPAALFIRRKCAVEPSQS